MSRDVVVGEDGWVWLSDLEAGVGDLIEVVVGPSSDRVQLAMVVATFADTASPATDEGLQPYMYLLSEKGLEKAWVRRVRLALHLGDCDG